MKQAAVYLTEEGRKKLEEELEHLITVRRPEIAEMIRDAKEAGDISENAAYDESKEQQAMIEGRIRNLEEMLARAEAIEHDPSSGVVALGSRVTVRENGGTGQEVFQIVGSAEASPSDGRISNESPLGKALMGHKEGDEATYRTPGGDALTFTIIALD